MSQDLVFKIFLELATLEGKRKPTGEWLTGDVQELPRLLKRAHQIVQRASAGGEEEVGAPPRPAPPAEAQDQSRERRKASPTGD